jgi:hypothetical protein
MTGTAGSSGPGAGALDARSTWRERVGACDWARARTELDEWGYALLGPLLTPGEAAAMAALYADDARFRSTIDRARHRFGEGEYRYFDHPLPRAVDGLRRALYPRLLPIARDWWSRLGREAPWPDHFDDWLDECHQAGQVRPTPLLLRYEAGGWNALHRDLYGDLVFPLQVVVNLTRPDVDYTGGELVMVEQRPRAQSRATAVSVPHGHGLVFTTRERPVPSARGWSIGPVRHGVSAVRSGWRLTLGLIFHDAA